MKKKSDPRHIARVNAVKQIFQDSFIEPISNSAFTLYSDQNYENVYMDETVKRLSEVYIKGIRENFDGLNSILSPFLIKRRFSDTSQVDLAILRLGAYELKFTDTPKGVVIDEAVEIAKDYGSEKSSQLINAVLQNL